MSNAYSDEHDGPDIALFPHPAPGAAEFADGGNVKKILDAPMPPPRDAMPPGNPEEEPEQPPQRVGHPYAQPHQQQPVQGHPYQQQPQQRSVTANAVGNAVPAGAKKRDQATNNVPGASGSTTSLVERRSPTTQRVGESQFDNEWASLVESLPSPTPQEDDFPVPLKQTPPTPPLPMGQQRRNGSRENVSSPQPQQQPLYPSRRAPIPPMEEATSSSSVRPPVADKRSASAPNVPPTPKKSAREIPSEPSTPKQKNGAELPDTPTSKPQRRRTLSLSSIFTRKKKHNFDDLPPMPGGDQVPKSPKSPKSPKTPKTPKGKEFPPLDESISKATGSTPSTKRERRKTLKEVFGMGGGDKSVRKSKSKPDLRRRNSFDLEPVPPLPAAGRPGSPSPGRAGSPVPSSAAWPGGAPAPVSKTAVPEALAALTANANKDKPRVEVVPDVFAAFNSSTTSLINTSTVRRQTMKSPTGEEPRVPSPLRESVEEGSPMPSVLRDSKDKPLPAVITRGSDEKQRPSPAVHRRSDERQTPSPVVTRRSDERNQPSPVVTRRSDERRTPSPIVTKRSDERLYQSASVSRPAANDKPQSSFIVKGGAHTGGARMPNNQAFEEDDYAARQRHAEALAALEGHGKKSKKERKAADESKEKKKNRTRSQSLSKRISMSVIGVFKRKKDGDDDELGDLPDVPALPAAYIKHSASTPSLRRGPSPMGTISPESTWGRSTGAQVIAQLGGRSPESTWGRSQGAPTPNPQHFGSVGSTTSLAKREKRLHNIQRIPPPRLNDDERLASASSRQPPERSASPASVEVPNVTLPLKIVKQPSLSMKDKPLVMAKSPARVASPTSVEGLHTIASQGTVHDDGDDFAGPTEPLKTLPRIPISTSSPIASEPPRVASPILDSPTLGFDPMSPKAGSYKRLSQGMPAALAATAFRKRSIEGLPATQSPEVAAQFRQLIQAATPPPVISELPTEDVPSLSGLRLNTGPALTFSAAADTNPEQSAVTPTFTTSSAFAPQLAPLQIQQQPITPSREVTSPSPTGNLSPGATPERFGDGTDAEPLSPNASLHSPGNSIHNIEVEVKTATRQSMIRSTSQPILAAVAAGSVVSFGSSGNGSALSRVPTNEEGTVESDGSTPTPSGNSSHDESPFFRATTSNDRSFPGGPPKYSSHMPEDNERTANKTHEANKPSMSSIQISRFSMASTESRHSLESVDSIYSQRDSRLSKDMEGFMPQAMVTTGAGKSRHVSSFSIDSAMSTAALIAENDVSDSDSLASTPTKPSLMHGPLSVRTVEMALADTSEVLITPVGSDSGDMEELVDHKAESSSSRSISPSPSVASSVLLPSVSPTPAPAPQQTAASAASSLFAMISNSVSQASESVANAVTAVLGTDHSAAARDAGAKSPESASSSNEKTSLPQLPEMMEEKDLPPPPPAKDTEVIEKALPPPPGAFAGEVGETAEPASPERSEDKYEPPSTPGPWQAVQSTESLASAASKRSSTSNDIPETPTTTTSNSIYATPTSNMSPVRSTHSHRGSIGAYDSDDGVTRNNSQRRGSMPAALRATAIRRRTTSQPLVSAASSSEPPSRLEFSSPEPGSPIGLGRPVVLRSASMPTQQLFDSPRALSADITGPASMASSLPWLAETPAVAEVEEVLESTSPSPTIDSASEVATIRGSVKDEHTPVPSAAALFPDSKSSSGCNGGMTSPELSVESRVDSPIGFSLSGESEDATHAMNAPPTIDSFVVPFPPDAEHAPLGAMPRSPTVPANYTATASARERTRRDSGQNMRTVGGYTISRRPAPASDTGPVIQPARPRQPQQPQPAAVEMDFSARSSMGPTGPEFSLWLESTANSAPIEELEELTQSPGFQSAKYRRSSASDEPQRLVYDSPASSISTASTSRPMRRPLPNPDDFRGPMSSASSPVRENMETSSVHSSSGSDDGPALCTPRTPDTAHLVSDFGSLSKAAGGVVGASKVEQVNRGLPNRPMHVDMGEDESFATAREGME